MEIKFKYPIGAIVYAIDKPAMKKFIDTYGKVDGIIETIHTKKFIVAKHTWDNENKNQYNLTPTDGLKYCWETYKENELSDDLEGLANSYLQILLDKFKELSDSKKEKLTAFVYSFLNHYR